jgi:sporulation protein YlmC with PRC-barrel domain
MKNLLSATALALLLAAGSAFAAEDGNQPDGNQPNASSPNMAQPNAPSPNAALPAQQAPTVRSTETIPPNRAIPISEYYKQSVYDTRDSKIGDIRDLLLDESGKVNSVIIGVGGFLGIGEKNVAVPFSSLKVAEKNGSRYLVLQTTKEALETAPGYTHDDSKKVWVPATRQG